MKDLLRRLATATEPDAGVTDRLRARLSPPSVGPALRGVGDVDAGVVGRLQSGMAARRARRAPWRVWVGAGAVALLAVGWIAADPDRAELDTARPGVASGSPVGEAAGQDGAEASDAQRLTEADTPGSSASLNDFRTSAPPDPTPPATNTSHDVSPAPRLPALARSSGSPRGPTAPGVSRDSASPGTLSPSDLVLVTSPGGPPVTAPPADPFATLRLPDGVSADRQGRRSTVRWEVGTLTAGLSNRGVAELAIVTREGLTRVEDGEVAVTRDRLGTRVSVRRGAATVTCEGGPDKALAEGDTAECLPTRALGWLGRAEALQESGAPLADVLAATAAGRAAGPTDPAFGELVALEVDVLRAAGDLDAARAAAARYPSDGPRAVEMSHFQKP